MGTAGGPVSRPVPAIPGPAESPAGLISSGRMSLEAVVADPLTDPFPAGWDEFVAAQRLRAVWRSGVLRQADWYAQAVPSLVLVREASSSETVALFHARHVGPGRRGRFARPGRVPLLGLTQCFVSPAVTPGFVFSDALDLADRTEACRVFERSLRPRAGWGHLAIAYRNLFDEHLAVVPAAGRVRVGQGPEMVIDNAWPDLAGYLASLPRKWRSQLKRIQGTVRDDGLRVEIADAVEPDEASWLAEVVRHRYRSGGAPRPPWPPRLFAEFGRAPGCQFLTYRSGCGRLVGCTSFIDDGRELVMMVWGTRGGGDGPRRDLYFDQYLRMVELMIRLGRERLQLGFGMNAIKARYGARPLRRWTVVGRW